ncbi:MAG TPA: hypothetical protein VLU92_05625 [Candidatus Dormibacteraeota bacterium]|nr:hypothetical protein [Candidatus Dormibacteraeota bacterium]
MVAATAVIGFGGVGALADPSNHWQLANGSAQGSEGIATVNFSVADKTRLLYNSKDRELLGNLLSSTMTATFTVSGVNEGATFTASGTCGSTPATARLFFESIPPGAKFAYTNYWWADASTASYVLANGTATIKAVVDPTLGLLSDWNGQTSAANAEAFNAAAANVTEVGLSFGGGCFFENGVGTTDGSGTFTLDAFTS